MEKDKNISVTLVTPQESEKSVITISFSLIFKAFKSLFRWWLVLAIIFGLLTSGISILMKKSSYVGNVEALIEFNYKGIEKGLDPDGNEFDVTKIKSPSIIESALKNMEIDNSKVDLIRQNIEITGVMPQSVADEMSLYYKSYSKNLSMQAVESLLGTTYYPEQYIISFNYFGCGYSVNQGTEILNAVLNAYSTYFFDTYNYNIALGSAVSVIDYTEYDYAEAANIFSSTLNDIEEYITNIKSNDENNFRSSLTGYTFDDLIATVEMLKQIDLDRVSSYITINNVTNNDIEAMVSYYQYMVDNIEKSKAVELATLTSINDSIQKYKKDPVILVIGSGNSEENDSETEEVNKAYDDLMLQKIETQKKISKYNQNIKYYNRIISSFSKSKSVSQKDIEEVSTLLSNLNQKVDNLIADVNKTVEEYYSKVAFANSFKILVPASGSESEIVSSSFMPFIISEILVFAGYVFLALIIGLVESNKAKKQMEKVNDEDAE